MAVVNVPTPRGRASTGIWPENTLRALHLGSSSVSVILMITRGGSATRRVGVSPHTSHVTCLFESHVPCPIRMAPSPAPEHEDGEGMSCEEEEEDIEEACP
jgi:hypothetical protein